jgi:hypothetical protein
MTRAHHPPPRRRLSPDQELDLWIGPCVAGAFASDDERRAAWIRDRDRLSALFAAPGRRLMAWWQFEAPIAWPGIERQASALYEAGLLGEAEKAELEREWRQEFDNAQDSNFWLCMGPGEILEGTAARRAHYREADIPAALVRKWTAEHRRQARTVRQIEAMATSSGA